MPACSRETPRLIDTIFTMNFFMFFSFSLRLQPISTFLFQWFYYLRNYASVYKTENNRGKEKAGEKHPPAILSSCCQAIFRRRRILKKQKRTDILKCQFFQSGSSYVQPTKEDVYSLLRLSLSSCSEMISKSISCHP